MRKRKYIRDYARIIAKEKGMRKKDVESILLLGWYNILDMMLRGEDINLKGFGKIQKTFKWRSSKEN